MPNAKTVSYTETQINQILVLLQAVPVQGPQQVKAMGLVYEILAHPVPGEVTEDKNTEG